MAEIDTTIQADVVPHGDNPAADVVVAPDPADAAGDQLEEEEPEPRTLDRDETINELVAKRKKQLRGENADSDEEEGDEEEPVPVQKPEEQMVELVVNGQKIRKTQAEVDAAGGVAAIQKKIAGDLKLAQAAEERKEIEREKQDLARARTELNTTLRESQQLRDELTELRKTVQQQREQGEVKTPQSKEELAKKAKDIAQKFFMGDADELESAVAAILEVGNRPAPVASAPAESPRVDEAALAVKIEKNLEFKREQKDAVAWFETDNKDLNTGGRRSYVNNITAELRQSHPEWGPRKIVEEAVRLTREELDIPVPAPVDPPKDPLKAKRDLKTTTVDRIPQASQRRELPVSGKQPKTPRQIFNDIAAKRSHS